MESCDSTISWDGILCSRCRYLFDSHVVRVGRERDLCREKKQDEDSNLLLTLRGPGNQNDVWWHDIPSLRRCATRCCKLWEIGLRRLNVRNLFDMEAMQTMLSASISANNGGTFMFHVRWPEIDSPTKAAARSGWLEDGYNATVFFMWIKNDAGEISSICLLITADHPP
jgi:hypothetical protein